MTEKTQRFFEVFIIFILIFIIVPVLKDSATVTQTDIESMNCVAIYNEDGTLHSLDGELNNRVVLDQNDAMKVISEYRQLFQVPESSDFRHINTQNSLTGKTYMFIQTYEGIDIAGTYVSIVTDKNKLSAITMDIDREIDEIASKRLSHTQIDEVVSNKYGDRYRIYQVQEIILNDRLVYSVYIANSNNIFTLDDMKLFIDAETKEIKTERQMQSLLDEHYNKEETRLKKRVYDWRRQEEIPVFVYENNEYLYDGKRNIQVIRANAPSWPLEITNYDGVELSVDLSTGADSLDLSAYQNLITSYDWYEKKFNRISYDDNNGEVTCVVGIDTIQDNAAYWKSFDLFIVGDANRYDKAPGMFLDTMGHEYTHAVFKSITGESTIRNGETEGINEAYADIFGCLIDGDWIMAQGIKEGKALSDPSNSGIELVKKRQYPEKYKDEYWSVNDGHINGMLLTRIAHKMTQNGFTEDDIANIWYQSIFYGYSDNSTYLTVRHNVEKAARALGYAENQIQTISLLFEEVGIT